MRKIYFLILTTFLILLTCSVGFLPDAHFHSAFADTEKCQTCKGSGQVSVSVSCSACSGQGKIGEVQTCVGCNGNGTITRSCDSCGGSGMVETPCSACGGSGMISGGMDAEGNPVEEPCGCGGGMVSESCGVCGGSGSFSETCSGCSGNGLIDERPACEECSGSGSVQSQILCSDCNGTGDALFNVIFTLPDQTKVTKRLKSLTSDVIREVWNTSDLMKNHYELKGFYLYKNGSQIPSSEVTLPYSIVEDGYSVLLAAKTYTVTWTLNLPSGVTDWYLSGSQGENLQTSTQSYESLACMDSQTYSGDSVPPPCAGAILGIGFLDPNMSGALPEGCNFLGWATDPEGTNIVFSFSGFDLELSEGNKPYYKPTSRLETPYYITADTTFYAVYDVKSYSIEYNLNGGTLGENFPSSWTYPEKLNIPDATKAGSVFAGWYYDENFTVKYNNGDAPNSSYVSDNTFRLYAKFTVPGLKFRSRTSTDGELTELTSSTNEFPVSYSGTIWEITGMPEYTFSSDSLVLDCFCLTTTQYKIRFYRLNVVVQSIVKVEELQTYSYPFKLDSSLYSLSTDGIVYADADLYDYVTVSDPLAAVATFNFWEWSYEKIDGTWVGTKRFLGHTTETRLLAVSNYKVSYLLGRVGLNSTRSVFRIDGPVTVTYPLIGGMNIAVSVDITVGLKSKIDIHLYADDESTKAYLNDEKPSYQPVTPNVPSNNGSVLDSIGSSFGAILKPLIIVAVIVFAAWLAVNLFGSRRRR